MLAKGWTEHPEKESSNSYNTWLSRVRTKGDRDQGGAGEQRSPVPLCTKPVGKLGCVAGWESLPGKRGDGV